MRTNPYIRRPGGERTYISEEDWAEEIRVVVPSLWDAGLREAFSAGRVRKVSAVDFKIVAETEPFGRADMIGRVVSMTVEGRMYAMYPPPDIDGLPEAFKSGRVIDSFEAASSYNVYPTLVGAKHLKPIWPARVNAEVPGTEPDPRTQPYFKKPLRDWKDAVYAAWKFALDRNEEAAYRDKPTFVEARGCKLSGVADRATGKKPWNGNMLVEVYGSVDYIGRGR